jgi:hypothetical protein
MERQAVRSRDIAIVGYDPKSLTLEVAFRNGGVYHYSGVPETIYKNLMAASSHGSYFQENIKEKYPFRRVR